MDYKLSLATWEDYNDIVDMSIKFYNSSNYKDIIPLENSKVAEVVMSFLNEPQNKTVILAKDKEGNNIGMIAGIATEMLFNYGKIAAEQLWWMEPEYRGSRISLELLESFHYWAKDVMKCDFVQMASLNDDIGSKVNKFYKRKGYSFTESAFIRKV